MVYKITIRLNDRDQLYSTSVYSYSEDKKRIKFRDKFGNQKDFSTDPTVLLAVEEASDSRGDY